MVWLVALFSILLVGGLAAVFVMHARAIRRDVDQRFERLRTQLEEEAQSVVRHLGNEHRWN